MFWQTLGAGGGEKEKVYVVERGMCCGSTKKIPKKEQDQRVASVA